jgi:AraC-like DNA-binding protein
MKYQEFAPGEILKPYVKCFYVCEYDNDFIVHDKAFATGCVEMMFNLSDGVFETGYENKLTRTPKVELWGQIIKPLEYRSLGKATLLGIRFFPHTASLFLNAPVNLFNDSVSDLLDVVGSDAKVLHERLRNTSILTEQLNLLEGFLMNYLPIDHKKQNRFKIVENVIADVKRDDFFDNIEDVASKYGVSSRYLQKLFLEFTGLTPKLYHKITRFQKSLILTGNRNESLTSIAYLSGYFDQSHFVRDFKSFTGVPPSAFNSQESTLLAALQASSKN